MERAVSEACTTLARFNPFPHHFFLASSLFQSRIHPTPDMSDQPELSHLQLFFEAAVQDYKKQTGIALIKHPLVGKLRNCDSVESVTAVLGEQMQAFSGSQEKDKVLKSVEKAVSVLYKFSATANFGQDIGLVRPLIGRCSMSLTLILQNFPPVTAIHTGIGILLSVCAFRKSPTAHHLDIWVQGVTNSYGLLVDFLETFETFLKRLDIYAMIPPTVAMNEMVIKILVELLSTLALAVKQRKEGNYSESVFGAELCYTA